MTRQLSQLDMIVVVAYLLLVTVNFSIGWLLLR